jgi:uncharacterized protein
MGRGGFRKGSGRPPWTEEQKQEARQRYADRMKQAQIKAEENEIENPPTPAEAKKRGMEVMFNGGLDPKALAAVLPEIIELSERYAKVKKRTPDLNPFQFAKHPDIATPPEELTMAMDSNLSANNEFASNAWLAGGVIQGITGEGLLFLGYPYLAELAQRPEYRVISETIADDATRKWIDFEVTGDENENKRRAENDPKGERERMADPDERKKRVAQAGKTDKVKQLKDDQERLAVRDCLYRNARDDGFFGRSHLFMKFGDNGADPEQLKIPIGDGRDSTSRGLVGKGDFKELQPIEPVWTYPLMYNAADPARKDFYNPQVWYVQGKQYDGSRLLTFIGHPVPDLLKPAYSFGGLSLSQMAKPYVDIWLTTRQSVADLIHSFSVMVLGTDMSTSLQPGQAGALLLRAALFNALRDNQGLMLINKNTEEFQNVSASLAGLHELQAQAQEHMASVSRIPLVKLTGISPSGLNASSEGEIMVYDDTIRAYQNRFMRPNLTRIINFEQLSLFGEIDPELTFQFEPLRELTEAEQAEKEKNDADRDEKYVGMGVLAPAEIRKRIANDPDLPYTEIDADDLPDLLKEETEGLEPEGGRPNPVEKGGGKEGS